MTVVAVLRSVLFMATLASAQTAWLNIAFLALMPTPSPYILGANYTDSASNQPQVGWQQGLQLYRDSVNAVGGFEVLQGNASVRVLVNVTFVNVARPTDAEAAQVAGAVSATQAIVSQTGVFAGFGPISVVIAPTVLAPGLAAVAAVCESSQACLAVLPTTIASAVWQCAPPLAPECVTRGVRAGARWRFAFTTSIPSVQVIDDWLNLMRFKGAASVAIVRTASFSPQCDWAAASARALGMSVVHDLFVDEVSGVPANTSWPAYAAALRDVYRPDLLAIFSGYSSVAQSVVCADALHALRVADYLPKAVNLPAGCQSVGARNDPRWKPEQLSSYAYSVGVFVASARGLDYHAVSSPGVYEPWAANATHDSPAVFKDALTARFGAAASTTTAVLATLVPLTVQKAMENMGSAAPTPAQLSDAVVGVNSASAYGRIAYDQWRRMQDRSYLAVQFGLDQSVAAQTRQLTPLQVGVPPVYPSPTWSERVFVAGDPGAVPAAAAAPTAVALLYLVLLLVGLIALWAQPAVRAHTPAMQVCTLAGCAMLLVTNLLGTPTAQSNGTCMGQVWTLALGYTLAVVPANLKTVRLFLIFYQRTVARRAIVDCHLLIALSVVAALDAVVLSVWTAVAPLTATTVVVDPLRPIYNYQTCLGEMRPAYVLVAIKALMLVATCVLAFITRNTASAFNESKVLGLTVYTVSIVLAVFGVMASLPGAAPAWRVWGLVLLSSVIASFAVGWTLLVARLERAGGVAGATSVAAHTAIGAADGPYLAMTTITSGGPGSGGAGSGGAGAPRVPSSAPPGAKCCPTCGSAVVVTAPTPAPPTVQSSAPIRGSPDLRRVTTDASPSPPMPPPRRAAFLPLGPSGSDSPGLGSAALGASARPSTARDSGVAATHID